jgi:hypothetical protein
VIEDARATSAMGSGGIQVFELSARHHHMTVLG